MKGRAAVWLLGIATSWVGASPLDGADPTSQADEIVARHVQARGGAEALARIRSLVYRGQYSEGEHHSQAAMALMRPFYKLVGDPARLSSEFREGYDGSAWEFYGDPGIVLRTVGPASAAARHGVAIEGPLTAYRERGSTVTLLGTESIGGRRAYRLRVRMRDGFEEDEFVDAESWMWVAARKTAPIHAFGEAVATETRFSDCRSVAGVLFAHCVEEAEIASGKTLNEMRWTSIEANVDIPEQAFSPPLLAQTPLQRLLSQLFAERTDVEAVLWSYEDFRRAFPDVDSDRGIQAIGYQILKMGETATAIALLQANARHYPRSSGAAFALGRAYCAALKREEGRAELQRALALDPASERARKELSRCAP